MMPASRSIWAWWGGLLSVAVAMGAEPGFDTQLETIAPLTPEAARAAWKTPHGFQVHLYSHEPNIRQPIGIATDGRGRLWVAENYTYAESSKNFDLAHSDRIVVAEDVDHDGRADKHTVFLDKLQKLTSVEVGYGGVWAMCPPNLYFIPDADRDDRPDGPPQVVLDGWNGDAVRHNIANGLRFGPDGWLYGRHGILATSTVGAPGTAAEQRAKLNCAIWRYHPVRKTFEVVCQGTTNPWGHDWDQHGELFFINTVIGHLWHVVPGAYFERMYGDHFNPHLFRMIPQTADHLHWDTREVWHEIRSLGITAGTDAAGGGHAHSGLMIYQGDGWPAAYRNRLFTVNYHGRRLNCERIDREGATFVGRHEPDFIKSSDPYFRGVELLQGDGGVYIADWSDIGECHDNDGVHRSSGRIFKVTYGTTGKPAPVFDLARATQTELARHQSSTNEWLVRQARVELATRKARGDDMAEAVNELRSAEFLTPDVPKQLRVLWALYGLNAVDEATLVKKLASPHEAVRTWAIRLLVDGGAPSSEVQLKFAELAKSDPSGLVATTLASAMGRLPLANRWALVDGLSRRAEWAGDRVYPLMVWYGIEPAVASDRMAAVRLATASKLPVLQQFIPRRLVRDGGDHSAAFDALTRTLPQVDAAVRRNILQGWTDGLHGQSTAKAPAGWTEAAAAMRAGATDDSLALIDQLSVKFGDEATIGVLRQRAADANAGVEIRRRAIRTLVESRRAGLHDVYASLVEHPELGADAVRGLAASTDPTIFAMLMSRFGQLAPAARVEAIALLTARPMAAKMLFQAVKDGSFAKELVPAFQLRQVQSFRNAELNELIDAVWPELSGQTVAKKTRIEDLKQLLTESRRATGDVERGRALFTQSCSKCHRLHGQGGGPGPELTGSQRGNLNFLLENIVDPSATVAASFRMSVVELYDGRVLNGVITERTNVGFSLQTPTEKQSIRAEDVESVRETALSMMPDNLLDALTPDQLADLFAYLMLNAAK